MHLAHGIMAFCLARRGGHIEEHTVHPKAGVIE
jgi:hypothetical protein